MKAWAELQMWLIMNVGSKEADACSQIVARMIQEIRENSADAKMRSELEAQIDTMTGMLREALDGMQGSLGLCTKRQLIEQIGAIVGAHPKVTDIGLVRARG